MNHNELISEVQRLLNSKVTISDEGMSFRELQKLLDMPETRLRTALQQGAREGVIRCFFAKRANIFGVLRRTEVYGIVESKQSNTKRNGRK